MISFYEYFYTVLNSVNISNIEYCSNSPNKPNFPLPSLFPPNKVHIDSLCSQGEYNEGKYRTLMRYVLLSEQNFTAYAEVDVSGKAYSINLNADLNNNTNVNVDVHFDQ